MSTAQNCREAISRVRDDVLAPDFLVKNLESLKAEGAGTGEMQNFIQGQRCRAMAACTSDAGRARTNAAYFHIHDSVPFWEDGQSGEQTNVPIEMIPV